MFFRDLQNSPKSKRSRKKRIKRSATFVWKLVGLAANLRICRRHSWRMFSISARGPFFFGKGTNPETYRWFDSDNDDSCFMGQRKSMKSRLKLRKGWLSCTQLGNHSKIRDHLIKSMFSFFVFKVNIVIATSTWNVSS